MRTTSQAPSTILIALGLFSYHPGSAFQPSQPPWFFNSRSFVGRHLSAGAAVDEAAAPTATSTTTTIFDGTVLSEVRGDLAVVAEEIQLASLKNRLSTEELIATTKDFIECSYGGKDTTMLAESFQFIGPFVGPLNREQYVSALEGSLNPADGFPDLCGRQYGFVVDPLEAGRVWWFTRATGLA
jgi:hypothetical protein